ncbi:MAG: 5-(carboxyamino)imidazole ribonucleotide mutase [Methylotenera sp.]
MENIKPLVDSKPIVAIIMGSDSDWPVMKNAAQILADFGVAYEAKVVSAHRTPDLMFQFAESAVKQGYQVIIAGAGGAAHLPGMVAAKTTLPVLGVPVPSKHLQGQDSLLSIVQMPKGIPVATFAIGDAGAANAALFAVSMLANHDANLAQKLLEFRKKQSDKVHVMELSDQP